MQNKLFAKSTWLPWVICSLGALFYSYEYLLRMSPSVMKNDLMSYYHLTGTQFGFLAGSYYYYSYVAMQILVGLMMDWYGPRRLLTIACLMCAGGAYMFACSDYLVVAMIGRFLIGLGSAFAFVGAAKTATIWLPPQRFAFVSGVIFCLGMLGAVFGDTVLRMMVDSLSWQTSIFAAAGAGVVITFVIWFVVRDVNPYPHTQYAQHISTFGEVLSGLVLALKNSQIWLSGIVGCLLYLFLSAFAELWGVDYLGVAHGLVRADAGDANSMIFLGCAVGAPLWGWFSDFMGRRRLPIILGATGALLCFCALLFMPHMSLTAIYCVLFLFGFLSSVQILVFAIAREVTPIRISGTAIGLLNMLVMIGGALFPPVMGKILDMNWDGVMVAGARVYSEHAYTLALSIIPLGILVGILLTLCIRETFCKIHVEEHQENKVFSKDVKNAQNFAVCDNALSGCTLSHELKG